jgi:hypothetical protein
MLADGRMVERTGVFEVCFRVVAEGGEIHYRQDGARMCIGSLRFPMPSWLAPRVHGRAWAEPGENAMRLLIRVAAPIVGELVTYGGPLEREV